MDKLFHIQPALKSAELFKYRALTPRIVGETLRLSRGLKKAKILHINSTARGGGVAELLLSHVPYERALGIDACWAVFRPELKFFEVTKKLHNLLQGDGRVKLTEEDKEFYLAAIEKSAASFRRLLRRLRPDLVLIHDLQPLPLICFAETDVPALARLHIDTSTPEEGAFRFLSPYFEWYRIIILTHPAYRPPWMPARKVRITAPAIDPLAEKNLALPHARQILSNLSGLNPDYPIAAQISRFDPWKDPMGVIHAYYIAKNKIPRLQLILAGSHASDDPEGAELFDKVQKHVRGDPDIFFFTDHNSTAVNAIQTASDVILQKSIREGFGLTVTEAMWKEKPVIGGNAAGIAMQITNGKNGFLVSSPEEAALRLAELLENPALGRRLGRAAKKTVLAKFLLPRQVRDHLKMYGEII